VFGNGVGCELRKSGWLVVFRSMGIMFGLCSCFRILVVYLSLLKDLIWLVCMFGLLMMNGIGLFEWIMFGYVGVVWLLVM